MKKFELSILVSTSLTVEVKAESMEDAIQIGQDMDTSDLYTLKGPAACINFDSHIVDGVWSAVD